MIEQDFDRVFNELFEAVLINPWRERGRARSFGKALIIEDEENYRVRLAVSTADPDELEVEVSDWRLTVRTPGVEGGEQNSFDFSQRIDIERVTARFEAGILDVMVPKARGRKIEVR
jgi:HSP20 family molecular chaperone IbpA